MDEITSTTPASPWSPPKLILFRFTFAYLILHIIPLPLMFIPALQQAYTGLWAVLVQLVGEQMFGVENIVEDVNSGDTTYNYVQVFCFLVLATVITSVWTLVDRGRSSYPRLYEWLRVCIRFGLVMMMITYGAVKVIPYQFRGPPLERLVQPFGECSPMGLLWTFMAASKTYTVFTGVLEMLGGLLLTVRRTTLLGALVSIGVLSNVVMLNFNYDVPVKLFSCHLLAMAIFLAAPDLPRLGRLFVFNRPVGAVELRPLFRRKWLERGSLVLRTVFVVGFTGLMLFRVHGLRKNYVEIRQRSLFYGIWNVEEFELDGEIRLPLVTDADRWRRVIFDSFIASFDMQIAIQPMENPIRRFDFKIDSNKQSLELTNSLDPEWQANLTYVQSEPDLLEITGEFDGRIIRAKLRRRDAPHLLLSRGFHWVNEYPFLQ